MESYQKARALSATAHHRGWRPEPNKAEGSGLCHTLLTAVIPFALQVRTGQSYCKARYGISEEAAVRLEERL